VKQVAGSLAALLPALALVVAAGAEPPLAALGELPGGAIASEAFGISPDGSVIVGRSASESGEEAFRWEGGVMRGLGDLPGICRAAPSPVRRTGCPRTAA